MERLEFAVKTAKEAGELTLKYYQSDLAIERKKDGTPVTAADRGAETLIRERITEFYPDDAILGEEFPNKEGTSGWRWILDPIDGTKSFIHGVPLYSTLIGVEYNGESRIGVIWIPALSEGVWAEKGKGAWQENPRFSEPKRAHVSQVDQWEESLFLTSETESYDVSNRREVLRLLDQKCRITRTWGDAYGFYLVATGRAEMIVDPELGDWDAGPLLNVLEEAGGHFTDWNGNPTIYGKEGVGVNDAMFKRVIEITSRFPKPKRT